MTWKIVRIPAHIVIINQSGAVLQNVAVETSSSRIEVGTMGNSETRRVAVDATPTLRLRFDNRGWTSAEGLSAGQSVVLYVKSDGRVEPRSRLGTLAR